MLTTYRYYTNREMRHIQANWQTRTDEELAADLNRTPLSIKNFKARFKLTKKHINQQPIKP